MCHCGNMGVEQTSKKSRHRKVNSGEENSSAAPARIQTRDLSITSPALYQQAALASFSSIPKKGWRNVFTKDTVRKVISDLLRTKGHSAVTLITSSTFHSFSIRNRLRSRSVVV